MIYSLNFSCGNLSACHFCVNIPVSISVLYISVHGFISQIELWLKWRIGDAKDGVNFYHLLKFMYEKIRRR